MKVALQPAYVLHSRPYRDTSLIIECFTRDHGRVAAVARGAKRARSAQKGQLQPFVPLLLSWTGRGELVTLTGVENHGMPMFLTGKRLVSGLYLNELLMRVLQRDDAYANLFDCYAMALQSLWHAAHIAVSLRVFEKQLLTELGYGLPLEADAETGETITADAYYRYDPARGFVQTQDRSLDRVFRGASLQALAMEQLPEGECLLDAKRLLRVALAPLLGQRPLRTRELLKPV